MKVTRRDFLKGSALLGTATLAMKYLKPVSKASAELLSSSKEEFIRSTDSPNCTGACGFIARVVDGRLTTLTQAADYPEKEYNPRGCLRGLSMMNLLYGKDRLKYPLIRTGKRGEGKFRRASWEEALDYTAGKLKEIATKYGPEAVGVTVQVGGTGYVQKGAMVRLAGLNHWSIHHAYDQNGDLPMFWPMTFGVQTVELEGADWARAKYTMIFGSNPLVTRVPDAKHLVAAKKNGKLVVFDPDHSATAAKADEWIPLAPDTDTALALAMAKVMVEKKLYDEAFIRDFTDMPILVRRDSGKRLLASEVQELAASVAALELPPHRAAYVVAKNDGSFSLLNPLSTAALETAVVLEGEWEVKLTDGTVTKVTTVFSELKLLLNDYSCEKASIITSIPAATIERLAVEAATIKPLHIIFGASGYQWYHSDLKGRALALLVVLTGNIGTLGAGISTYAGQYKVRFKIKDWWYAENGKLNWVPYLYFLQGKGKIYPANGIKAMFSGWGNPFDQHNMADTLREKARSGDLEFIITTDIQMTTSCNWSDVVLPAASFYEKYDITATPAHPYVQLQQRTIKPLFESRSEFWIMRELAKRLSPEFEKDYYPELDEDSAALAVIERLLSKGGPEVEGITLPMLKKGPVRLRLGTPNNRQIPFYAQIKERLPFPPITYPVPLETTQSLVKSGRIEFYKDEDTFLELGEKLPLYKPPFEDTEYKLNPETRALYPLRFITRNSLYRVHSTHSNNRWMNELQNDKPKVFLHAEDANKRGIKEGDHVELFNGRGKTNGYAVISKGAKPGVVIFEQGWWDRYLQGESYNTLTMPWIKPTHEVYFIPGVWSPNTCWNECLVDVKRRSV
ncbi:MAG: molybdopterin-dependent oxidoreductase [Oligoflexia bacterium]|nr:molybdopterin-dependent oxidoreductase [Oligoflexia bacterium]